MKLTNVNLKNDEVMETLYNHVISLTNNECFLAGVRKYCKGVERVDVNVDVNISDELKPFDDKILTIVNTVSNNDGIMTLDETVVVDIASSYDKPVSFHVTHRQILDGEVVETIDAINNKAYINKDANHLLASIHIYAESKNGFTLEGASISIDLYQL